MSGARPRRGAGWTFDELEFYRISARIYRRTLLIQHTLSTSDDSGDDTHRGELDLAIIDLCASNVADVHALEKLIRDDALGEGEQQHKARRL